MAILVTNDDGYSEGLKILLEAAKSFDKKSYAITPHKQRSAVSKALTLHKPLRIHKLSKDIFELSGSPADCVTFGIFSKDFPKPSVVLSGINWRDNTSIHSLFSSGTIAASLESTIMGVPSIAFSLYRKPREGWKQESSWYPKDKILYYTKLLIKKLKPHLKKDIFFNVNLPEKFNNPKIVVRAPQRYRFKVKIEKRKDPAGNFYYWITGPNADKIKGSDFYEVSTNNNIVITPVSIDIVRTKDIDSLKKIKFQ